MSSSARPIPHSGNSGVQLNLVAFWRQPVALSRSGSGVFGGDETPVNMSFEVGNAAFG
jgi:hypothetical protein